MHAIISEFTVIQQIIQLSEFWKVLERIINKCRLKQFFLGKKGGRYEIQGKLLLVFDSWWPQRFPKIEEKLSDKCAPCFSVIGQEVFTFENFPQMECVWYRYNHVLQFLLNTDQLLILLNPARLVIYMCSVTYSKLLKFKNGKMVLELRVWGEIGKCILCMSWSEFFPSAGF